MKKKNTHTTAAVNDMWFRCEEDPYNFMEIKTAQEKKIMSLTSISGKKMKKLYI